MDFLARQHLLERTSRHLMAGYVLIVAILTGSLALTAMGLIAYTAWSRPSFRPGPATYAYAAGVGALTAALSLIVTSTLEMRRKRRGLDSLILDLRAAEVVGSGRHPAEQRLVHVVEEMAIAAQLQRPRIFLLAEEPGINACALGKEGGGPALCVTLGCLYRMRRDELQAVIAHGFSDLQHNDPTLRLRLAALVGGLQSVSHIGLDLILMRTGSTDGRSVNRILVPLLPLCLVLGLNLLLTGALGWLLGELLGAAVMRRRVLLGDAAACQFTRNPQALFSALAKVGGFVFGSRLLATRARTYRYLFLCRTTGPQPGFLDAHPALALRLRSLHPDWNGHFAPSRIDTWLAEQQALAQV